MRDIHTRRIDLNWLWSNGHLPDEPGRWYGNDAKTRGQLAEWLADHVKDWDGPTREMMKLRYLSQIEHDEYHAQRKRDFWMAFVSAPSPEKSDGRHTRIEG